MVYTAEKALKDNGDKVPADIKADVEAKIAEVKTATAGTDIDAIKKASEALSSAMQKIGEAMAKEASTHEGEQPPTPPEGSGETGEAPEGKVHDV